jgi:hypothetical protein
MGMGCLRRIAAALPLGKRPGILCTRCLVGPRPGLDWCGKYRPPLGFGPRTVQAVASQYTILCGFSALFHDAVSTEAVGHGMVDDW